MSATNQQEFCARMDATLINLGEFKILTKDEMREMKSWIDKIDWDLDPREGIRGDTTIKGKADEITTLIGNTKVVYEHLGGGQEEKEKFQSFFETVFTEPLQREMIYSRAMGIVRQARQATPIIEALTARSKHYAGLAEAKKIGRAVSGVMGKPTGGPVLSSVTQDGPAIGPK